MLWSQLAIKRTVPAEEVSHPTLSVRDTKTTFSKRGRSDGQYSGPNKSVLARHRQCRRPCPLVGVGDICRRLHRKSCVAPEPLSGDVLPGDIEWIGTLNGLFESRRNSRLHSCREADPLNRSRLPRVSVHRPTPRRERHQAKSSKFGWALFPQLKEPRHGPCVHSVRPSVGEKMDNQMENCPVFTSSGYDRARSLTLSNRLRPVEWASPTFLPPADWEQTSGANCQPHTLVLAQPNRFSSC